MLRVFRVDKVCCGFFGRGDIDVDLEGRFNFLNLVSLFCFFQGFLLSMFCLVLRIVLGIIFLVYYLFGCGEMVLLYLIGSVCLVEIFGMCFLFWQYFQQEEVVFRLEWGQRRFCWEGIRYFLLCEGFYVSCFVWVFL